MRRMCTYVGACVMFGAAGILWSIHDIHEKVWDKAWKAGYEVGYRNARVTITNKFERANKVTKNE